MYLYQKSFAEAELNIAQPKDVPRLHFSSLSLAHRRQPTQVYCLEFLDKDRLGMRVSRASKSVPRS